MADPSWEEKFHRLQFNRNDGRHVSFGELGELEQICGMSHKWVAENSIPLVSQDLRYYIGATKSMTARPPTVTITKGWDGRIFNVVIVWLFVMVLFFINRNRVIKVKE